MEQGHLELITGTMFSGKSARLIKTMKKYSRKGRCLFIQPRLDNRNYFSKNVREEKSIRKLIDKFKVIHWVVDELPNNEQFLEWTKGIDYVFIDEGQFFENIWQVDEYANLGKMVWVSAILFTSEKKWFEPLIEFYPCVNKITWCQEGHCSYCGKKKKNLSTVYLGGTKSTDIEVGSDEKYGLACRECARKLREGN